MFCRVLAAGSINSSQIATKMFAREKCLTRESCEIAKLKCKEIITLALIKCVETENHITAVITARLKNLLMARN